MFKKWRVHGGFLTVWKDMQNAIETHVASILKDHLEINKIVCIGYSHGAALAVLATEDMEYLHGKSYEISGYGFGCPRVLWGIVPAEVKYRLRNFISVRNIPDIVTHVPPMLFGFRNAGTLIKVGRKGKYSPFKAHCASAYITELNATKGE
jgi:predicted lipase